MLTQYDRFDNPIVESIASSGPARPPSRQAVREMPGISLVRNPRGDGTLTIYGVVYAINGYGNIMIPAGDSAVTTLRDLGIPGSNFSDRKGRVIEVIFESYHIQMCEV